MSLIIETHVKEGIVLAGDSRTTYTRTDTDAQGRIVQRIGVHTSDTAQKVFLAPNNIGIAACGASSINNLPIVGFINDFIRQEIHNDTDIDAVPQQLLTFFNTLSPNLGVQFIVVGYKTTESGIEQRGYQVDVAQRSVVQRIINGEQGASWAGEALTLSRLITPVASIQPNGQYSPMPQEEILWQYFTLQDAVDFARYAVETTIKTMHFKNVVETVGGPVDILVITPDGGRWLNKKELL